MTYKTYYNAVLFGLSLLLFAGCAKDYTNILEPSVSSISAISLKALPEIIYLNSALNDSLLKLQVKLQAKIEDNPSVSAELLYYSNPLSRFSLFDDGMPVHSDSLKNDSVYSASLKLDTTYKNGSYQLNYYASSSNQSDKLVGQQLFFFISKNTPPILSNLSGADTVAASDAGTPFVFSVRVLDADGQGDISKVSFVYYVPGDLTAYEAEMNDLGQKGDLTTNDGIYTRGGTMYTGSPVGTWRFEFRAVDRAGSTSNILTHNMVVK